MPGSLFHEIRPSGRLRWSGSLLASTCIHFLVLGTLAWQARPVFVRPSSVAFGSGGASASVVYLAPRRLYAALETQPEAPEPRLVFHSPAPQAVEAREPRKMHGPATPAAQTSTTAEASRAGSPYGSLALGPLDGPEIRPAIPWSFADPVLRVSDLPPGVAGDVVVEVTIDTLGNITGSKIVKRLGYGAEEKVMAALGNWRFRPATRDGVPIASQQYVYFHFPTQG